MGMISFSLLVTLGIVLYGRAAMAMMTSSRKDGCSYYIKGTENDDFMFLGYAEPMEYGLSSPSGFVN